MIVPERAHLGNLGAVINTLPLYASLDTDVQAEQKTFAEEDVTRFGGMGAVINTLPLYADLDTNPEATEKTFAEEDAARFMGLGDGEESIF